jgi:Secretory lipase
LKRILKRKWTRPACTLTALAVLITPSIVARAIADPNTPATASAGLLPPDQDPFYRAPADIASAAPGRIVASREVTAQLSPLPVPVRSWQIAYRSNSQAGQPVLAVTTLISPTDEWKKPGKRPIVSYQVPEDSVGSVCAPSYNIVRGRASDPGANRKVDMAQLAPFLAEGWALAVPDHEGPQAYFGVGQQAGPLTLDGIRAVKSFAEDQSIGANSPVGMSGYSGGAQATGWAAQLQPVYAPDVKLIGAALGGLPADLTSVGKYIDGGPFSGFEFAVAQSFLRAYPSAGISALLNQRGIKDFDAMAGKCLHDILSSFGFRKLSRATTVADPLSMPAVAQVLTLNRLGIAGAPQTPIYDYHAVTDEVVPVGQDNETMQAWRAKGTKIQQVRDLVGEHAKEAGVRLHSVVSFLRDRFEGKPFEPF